MQWIAAAGTVLSFVAGCRQGGDPRTMQAAPAVVVQDSFATPESVAHDRQDDRYLVSNLNGSPFAEDDNGFISLLDPGGRAIALRWIDGASDSVTLNAPKGIAVSGEFIYVADINVLRRFDRRTGAPRGDVPVPEATFLNDLFVSEDGAVYFTDSGLRQGASGFEPSGTDAIYRLDPSGGLQLLARGDELGRPNGVAVTGDSVYVVSFGSGELYRIAGGARVDVVKLPAGSLDGIVIANGELFISSWDGKTIYRGPPAGPFRPIIGNLESPADLGHDHYRHQLLVPLFNLNELRLIPLAPQ
jgi:hypothetical protein